MFDGLKALRKVRDLEEAMEKLQRGFRQIEAEWLDTLDRNKRIMGRIAKRAEVVEKADERGLAPADGIPLDRTAEFLSKLDPTSRRIWERRLRSGAHIPEGG
jgi:hypothetical protein